MEISSKVRERERGYKVEAGLNDKTVVKITMMNI